MFDLTGKGALITGATGGIGEEIARTLHAQGANVVISRTREEKLLEVAAGLGSERVSILSCNLKDRAAVTELPKKAEEAVGQLDIVVNNAGMCPQNAAINVQNFSG